MVSFLVDVIFKRIFKVIFVILFVQLEIGCKYATSSKFSSTSDTVYKVMATMQFITHVPHVIQWQTSGDRAMDKK